MSKQAEALRLADALNCEWRDDALNYDTALDAAAELRCLHKLNQELVEALKEILGCDKTKTSFGAVMRARAAIAKATGGAK